MLKENRKILCLIMVLSFLFGMAPIVNADTESCYGVDKITQTDDKNGITTVYNNVSSPAAKWFYLGAVEVDSSLQSLEIILGELASDGGFNVAASTELVSDITEDGIITQSVYNTLFKNNPIIPYKQVTAAASFNILEEVTAMNADIVYLYAWTYSTLRSFGTEAIYSDNPDASSVIKDKKNLSIPDSTDRDIALPVSGDNGSLISWVSDYPEYLDDTGKCSQLWGVDVTVRLTATISKGSISMEKEFKVIVKKTTQIPDEPVILDTVSTADVTLSDEFLLNAEERDIDWLLELEPERFLYNWYRTSGITPTQEGYEDGWERTSGNNFRGHMFGHYMSALSQAYLASKDEDIKVQLLEKIKASVNGIVKCQEAYTEKYPSRAGYAAPFSEYWLNALDEVDTGDEDWNQKEDDNPKTYVVWYNLHKVVAGLIDVYKNVTDDEIGDAALDCVCDFVDYVYNCRVSQYTDAQKKKMLGTEYGGMADSLYELYRITGKAEYKICADGFIENDLFKVLAADEDVLSGLHANTTIPKLLGALKKYTVLTQNEDYYNELSEEEKSTLDMYYNAAVNFFDIVLDGHSFVTGGNSVSEHFRSANTISAFYQDAETHETCNEYNMLKLAKELFILTNEKKYSDYYENTFINAILASQNPETGEMTYFQPMGAGYSKVFNKTRFWCCTGTGTENFTKLGDSIYFKKNERVYVNMYFSSEMRYAERNLVLNTEADMPNDDTVSIEIKTLNGDDNVAAGTELYLRAPDWCASMPEVSYNGETYDYTLNGGYIVIENIADGDKINIRFPMEVRVQALKDNENVAAFRYGPVVLAARMGQSNVGQSTSTGVLVLKAVQDLSLPTSLILTDSDAYSWKKDIKNNLVRTEDTEDGFVQFKLNGTYYDDDLTFVPYYSIYNYRYGLYMNISSADSEEMQSKILSDKQELRNEEAASASLTQIDDNNYEATYNVQKSEDSSVGTYNGRNYRDAQKGGYFSYDLPIEEGVVNYLNTVYTKADNGRSFKILINDEEFVTETITNTKETTSDGFYTETREIPQEYTSGDNVKYGEIQGEQKPYITVTFRSSGGLVGGLYGISITQSFDTDPNLSELSFDRGVLSPEFDPDIKAYTLTVPNGTYSVSMKASPFKRSGLIYVDGILIDDTQQRTVTLNNGKAELSLHTYAQDHETDTEYTVTIQTAESDWKIVKTEKSVLSDGGANVTAVIGNLSSDKDNVFAAAAIYDGEGALKEIKTVTKSVAMNTEEDFIFEMTEYSEEIVLYFWYSDNCEPIFEKTTIK